MMKERTSPYYFFFNDPATTEIYTLSLHDALPISRRDRDAGRRGGRLGASPGGSDSHLGRRRSEEHTSELQSQSNLVCRLLLEKKNTYRVHVRQSRLVDHRDVLKPALVSI